MSTSRSCVLLFTGSLDTVLAAHYLQRLGIALHAVCIQSAWGCAVPDPTAAAARLGLPLTLVTATEDYLDVLRRPRHGYGSQLNPCLDCRIYQLRAAHHIMQQRGADFLASGDVLGQRGWGQKRRDLYLTAQAAGVSDLLLRPLSALHLPETLPERSGWVRRAELGRFNGRSRIELTHAARQAGYDPLPPCALGCPLAQAQLQTKLRDLLQANPDATGWDFELLAIGRQLRIGPQTKLVIGRRQAENEQLRELWARLDRPPAVLVSPVDFNGPTCLVTGAISRTDWELASGVVCHFAKQLPAEPIVLVRTDERQFELPAVVSLSRPLTFL